MRAERRLRIALRRLPGGEELPLPAYMTDGAAGADVCAAVEHDTSLGPGERLLVPLGFSLAIPPGFEIQIRPRSGLALKHGITLLNAPGTIDADYRGPVGVILANFGNEPFVVRRGERIAQMILSPVWRAEYDEEGEHDSTARALGGFGSTG